MQDIPYSEKELFRLGMQPLYSGRNLDEVAFPLGGIGTGSVSLGGWGHLRDWEIMNRPAKGFVVPNAFFTLKIRFGHRSPVTKVLQGPVEDSYVGDGHSLVSGVYCGLNEGGQGLPHFRDVTFTGHFPIATVSMKDPEVPLNVTLHAFNPFIPLNDKDSSIPVAIFFYNFENITDEEVSATVYGNLSNIVNYEIGPGNARARECKQAIPLPSGVYCGLWKWDAYESLCRACPYFDPGERINEMRKAKDVTGLYLTTSKPDYNSPRYGSLALATTWSNAKVWSRWKEIHSFKFWESVAHSEEFPPKDQGKADIGTVAADFTVKPYGRVTIAFILAWHFPIFEYYWERKKEGQKASTWKNFYATLWTDAWDVVLYTASNLNRLWKKTKLFHDVLFASTLPVHVLDAISSQLSTLKTNTCLRLEEGTFYFFEGCSNTSGCCEGSCTHVWNYAQVLPYLFPNLQQSILDAHLANSVQEDGFMTYRMPLPMGAKAKPDFHPAADGQMGIVLQVYREWQISGDDEWLRSVWPATKKILEFAWKYWDADKDGVMEGMQHNTYDVEFYGPNTMMGSLYLAALRAAEEVAKYLGEYNKAREYHKLFEKGSQWTDENLFNGEYYEQKVNPKAHEIWPENIRQLALKYGKDDKFEDWPKWQFGKGCLSDQMFGQWYANMLDLGYLYNSFHVRKTLQSIFKNNWKPNLWKHTSFLRIYAVNDEAGLITCTWPKGERPGYAFYYADEVWCGIEYQVASHMIYEGMLNEGLAIVMGTRNRYRGNRRNPFDEFECGHHYFRSMASYGLLLALSGFKYSAPEKRLGFAPKIYQKNFRSFFCTATGWGSYSQKIEEARTEFSLKLEYGSLPLEKLDLPVADGNEPIVEVTLDGERIEVEIERNKDRFTVVLDSVLIKRNHVLKVLIRQK